MGNRARSIPWWILYAVLAAIAFTGRLLLIVRGGGLIGFGSYDDGVYYSAGDALIHGRLPYLDYLFIQPPGVVLATAPFAWIGTLTSDTTGFIVGRIAFMLVGAASTVLVAVILRRFGFAAAAAGGIFYAVSYTAIDDERSMLLEPLGTVGILVALFVLSRPDLRRRTGWLLAGGVAAGMATGFKIWYIVPVGIIVAFAGRGWWRMLLGAIAGACAIYLPFFLPAPVVAFREIVLDQLGRGNAGVSIADRLYIIFGDFHLPQRLVDLGLTTTNLTAGLVALTVIGSAVALTVRGARIYVLLLAVDVAILLSAPSFFLHYASLTTPMLALVFGVAIGRVLGFVRWPAVRFAAVGVLACALVTANAPQVLHGTGRDTPPGVLAATASQVRGCVMAEDPTLLVVANVLTRDLNQGCALWPDVSGYTYGPNREILADGHPLPRPENAGWQRTVMRYLTSGAAAILSRKATGLDADSHHLLVSGGILYHQYALSFVRTPKPQS